MGLGRQRSGLPPPPSKATVAAAPLAPKRVSLRERFSKGTVEWSTDFERIKNLPRRPPLGERDDIESIVKELTERLRKPGGTQTLRDVQALALHEAPLANGLIAPIGTGGGKTLLGMLMPFVMNSQRSVLLLPPDLRPQFHADWETYGKHWKLPNLAGGKWFTPGLPVLHVIPYSELSSPKSSALLRKINPDMVMGDEIDALRNDTARVRRFKDFFAILPDTRFLGWSATLVSDSIENFWHLLAMALDDGSPVPLEQHEVRKWCRAIDPKSEDGYFMPGVLQQFCEPGESIRSGFRRRLVSTRGIVATEQNQLGIPLIFRERRPPPMPKELEGHLKTLRRKTADGGWKRPDGEELRTPVEVSACAKQLAEGFWLFWRFPGNETREMIDLWFDRRQSWNRELRAVLQKPSIHMDSPLLCENAAERYYAGGCTGCDRGPEENHQSGCRDVESHPLWPSYTYRPWIAVEDTVKHVTAIQWESDWLLQDAAAWGAEKPGIIWVDHPEFGHRLSKMSGFEYYGGGTGHEEILKADGSQSIICSINANRRGKNLQMFNRNLLVSFPSSNDLLEQSIGRSYRSGQSASEVTVDYYAHTVELENAIDTARSRAKFVFETMGTAAKLVYGEWRT